jgi:hypothetical protein
LVGCIGKVQWVERKGETENHWIPTCPKCQQVVDYESLQCKNPECRILLAWSDKTLYAKNMYLEDMEILKDKKDIQQQDKQQDTTKEPKNIDDEKDIWDDEKKQEEKINITPSNENNKKKTSTENDIQNKTNEKNKTDDTKENKNTEENKTDDTSTDDGSVEDILDLENWD